MKNYRFKLNLLLAFLFPLLFLHFKIYASPKTIYFFQLLPLDSDTYSLAKHLNVMDYSMHLALKDFQIKNPSCHVNLIENLNIKSEAELYETVKNVSQSNSQDKVIVGLTRSNFSRVAAKASIGSKIVGISSAAFTDELKSINPLFMTVSSPWQKQWEITYNKMKEFGCTNDNTIGVFSYKDVLSKYFRKGFEGSGFSSEIDSDDLLNLNTNSSLNSKKCIYMGTSLPGSIAPLTHLTQLSWEGNVFGMGDWTFYTPEMKLFLKNSLNRKFHIFAPLVWNKNENKRVQVWIKKNYQKHESEVEPLTIGVYDSAILALNYLCKNENIHNFDLKRWNKFGLLRDYYGLTSTGNLLSEMTIVELK